MEILSCFFSSFSLCGSAGLHWLWRECPSRLALLPYFVWELEEGTNRQTFLFNELWASFLDPPPLPPCTCSGNFIHMCYVAMETINKNLLIKYSSTIIAWVLVISKKLMHYSKNYKNYYYYAKIITIFYNCLIVSVLVYQLFLYSLV